MWTTTLRSSRFSPTWSPSSATWRSCACGALAMLVKFLAHGTGSAQAAADYLLRETDSQGAVREDVAVLRGDPDTVAAVADALEFEHKYTSGVIAWAPEDQPCDQDIGRVLDEFEQTAWAGLAPDRYAWAAVRPGDGQEPQHRAAGLAADLRPPGRGPEPRPGLEPPGRPGARQGAAAGAPRLHRGGGAAGGDRARRRPARGDPGLPAAVPACRSGWSGAAAARPASFRPGVLLRSGSVGRAGRPARREARDPRRGAPEERRDTRDALEGPFS